MKKEYKTKLEEILIKVQQMERSYYIEELDSLFRNYKRIINDLHETENSPNFQMHISEFSRIESEIEKCKKHSSSEKRGRAFRSAKNGLEDDLEEAIRMLE